jgi:hypothetical protein
MRYDYAYQRADFWHAFLAWEHEAQRATTEVHNFQPSEYYGDLTVATSEEEDEDNDDALAVAVKQEALLTSFEPSSSQRRRRRLGGRGTG